MRAIEQHGRIAAPHLRSHTFFANPTPHVLLVFTGFRLFQELIILQLVEADSSGKSRGGVATVISTGH